MANPTYPTLYYLTNANITIDMVADPAFTDKVEFDSGARDNADQPLAQISLLTASGDENTVDEPEISGGTKSLNKQNVGALPEVLELAGNVSKTAEGSALLNKIRKFYRSKQTHASNYPYGRIGFYSAINDFTYFDLHPTDTIGFSIKPPKVTGISQKGQVEFSFVLMLGGKDLVNQPGVNP